MFVRVRMRALIIVAEINDVSALERIILKSSVQPTADSQMMEGLKFGSIRVSQRFFIKKAA